MNNLLSMPLSYLGGTPNITGKIKEHPEDFVVREDLGFLPTGEGEHVFVYIRKKNCNTLFVLDKLANFANIPSKLVSYAGLKDKYAVTEQWFSLHIPGKVTPDFSLFKEENIDVLSVQRHDKKLKIGALKGNYFSLVLSSLSNISALEKRINQIEAQGFPNYFGEQRFGLEQQNLVQATKWANGEIKVKDRKKRGFYLSAIRSFIFNYIVSERISLNKTTEPMDGDAIQLLGSHSWFIAKLEELSTIKNRITERDVVITAPLVGGNKLGTESMALTFEENCLKKLTAESWLDLLSKERLEMARRAIIVYPKELKYAKLNDEKIMLEFWLPSGSYATSLVRELIQFSEPKE